MLLPGLGEGLQILLIHEVHSDDAHLLNTPDGEWFEILYDFPWPAYRSFAAQYYNALYDFNQAPPRSVSGGGWLNPKAQDEARQRLLFNRATAPRLTGLPVPILYQGEGGSKAGDV